MFCTIDICVAFLHISHLYETTFYPHLTSSVPILDKEGNRLRKSLLSWCGWAQRALGIVCFIKTLQSSKNRHKDLFSSQNITDVCENPSDYRASMGEPQKFLEDMRRPASVVVAVAAWTRLSEAHSWLLAQNSIVSRRQLALAFVVIRFGATDLSNPSCQRVDHI